MKWLLFSLLFVLGSVEACECEFERFDSQSASCAELGIVFRVMSVRLVHEKTREAEADIEIIRTYQGKSHGVRRIRYSAFMLCCGIHLDVGQYYAAFGSPREGKLRVHTGNMLSLFEYSPGNFYPDLEEIRAVLAQHEEVPANLVCYSKKSLSGFSCPPKQATPQPP